MEDTVFNEDDTELAVYTARYVDYTYHLRNDL